MSVTVRCGKRVLLETLAFLILSGFWVSARVTPSLPEVFPGDDSVVLLGNDPWFHLHQIEGAIEHFPRLIRWDVGSHYPKGIRCAPAGLFHLGAAAVSLGLGGPASAMALAPLVLAWSPVALGALSLAFLYLLAREIGGRELALLTLLLRILFPGEELERTLLGFGDYHAAEILLATAGLWTLAHWFNRLSANVPDSAVPFRCGRLWGTAGLAAFPFALFQFVWFGAPLHIAVILLASWFTIAVCLVRSSGTPGQIVGTLPVFLWLLALTGLIGWLVPDWIMSPSGHRHALLTLAAQCGLLLMAGAFLPTLSRRIGKGWSLLMFAFVAVAILWFAPLDHGRLSYQIHHFLWPRNPFVAEHLEVDASRLWYVYGILLPFVFAGFVAAFGRSTPPGTRFALCFIGVWAALWVRTSDFGYLTGALLPLLAAIGLLGASRLLASLPRKRSILPHPVPWIVIAANLTILLILPGRIKLPFLFRSEIGEMVLATPPWRGAMAWIREHTPQSPLSPTHLANPWEMREGFAYPDGSYGIFSHWSLGNLIPTLGQRIAVLASSRSPLFIDWFLETSETTANQRLDACGDIPYLILDATSVCDSYVSEALQVGLTVEELQVEEGRTENEEVSLPLLSYGERFRSAIGAKLYLGDGSGWSHHRLVYESPEESFVRYRLLADVEAVILTSTPVDSPESRKKFLPLTSEGTSWTEEDKTYFCYSGQLLPTVRIYERVVGATLVGKSDSREPAVLELDLKNSITGRTFTHRTSSRPEEDGTVRFTLPYPTTRETEAILRATGPCRIFLGKAPLSVEVDERAVREGATIRFGEPR